MKDYRALISVVVRDATMKLGGCPELHHRALVPRRYHEAVGYQGREHKRAALAALLLVAGAGFEPATFGL